MTYLLIFTIGPVQSFIASARKTQDLFAGSAILSHLVAAAYEKFRNKLGASNIEIVFPQLNTNAPLKEATNPNRFAAIVHGFDEEKIKALAEEVKKEIIEENFCDKAWGAIKKGLAPTIEQIAKNQLKTLPEVYWAAIEVSDGTYAEKYKLLESYLGGLKNIRNLKQLQEAGRKCNVDGVHNVIVYRKSEDGKPNEGGSDRLLKKLFIPKDEVAIIDQDDETSAKIWELSAGEGLSAISFYKRKYLSEPHDFPSTARIALMHILNNKVVEALPDFQDYELMLGITEKKNDEPKEQTQKRLLSHSDDQLFYEENINENILRKSIKLRNDKPAEKAHEAIRIAWKILADKLSDIKFEMYQPKHFTLPAHVSEQKLDKFTTTYYALLLFDGDKMGEWLSGERLTDKDKLRTYHQTLSKQLNSFAEKARKILVEPYGKTVYAAGEDFLGFVNLNYLLDVLKDLRIAFDAEVNKTMANGDFVFTDNKPLTFSAGIAIAHYKHPLSSVLDEARSAERKAKEKGGNRCCLSIMRHSGGTTRCILPFGTEAEPIAFGHIDALNYIINQLKENKFSNAFIYQLIREMRLWQHEQPAGMFQAEAKRLIERASNLRKDEKEKALKDFNGLFAIISESSGAGTEFKKEQLDNTFATLRIADFIQRNLKGETV